MTADIRGAVRHTLANRQFGTGALLLLGGGVLALAIGMLGHVPAILGGWLVGFAIWSCIPIGSMVLLMIHRLTGGEWGIAASAVLRPAAALTPLVLLASLPVLAGSSLIYPWAAEPSQIPQDVARWYLNEPWFVLRASIALIGWSVLGLVFAAGAGSALLAGLGLAFFGLTISFVAVDWYLSLDPQYVSSAFAAMIAIQQLLAALAFTAVLGPSSVRGKVAGDIGGLLIATLLGVVYLEYMSFVVAWYGDLPHKAKWYLERSSPGWTGVLIFALLAGALLPFAMLLLTSLRTSRIGLRVAGALILFGSSLHFCWMLMSAFENPLIVLVVSCATLVVLSAAAVFCARGMRPWLETRRAE